MPLVQLVFDECTHCPTVTVHMDRRLIDLELEKHIAQQLSDERDERYRRGQEHRAREGDRTGLHQPH
eukprot:14707229-Heterocapsa_arctica.AAC.1